MMTNTNVASSEQLRDHFSSIIPGTDILIPGDKEYHASIQRWSTTSVLQAAIVLKPKKVEDISAIVQYASDTTIPIAVRCGGHSCNRASSSTGIVIDLSLMRNVWVDTDQMTVTFEGGCLGSDVDKALEPHGLATITGLVNHVGLGGLALGGGIGMLTALHGLAIDNLLSAEVVIADGTILQASAEQNSDLFWAIRGAGAQFGVVTQFTMKAHKQGHVWSGVLLFGPDKLEEIFMEANRFQAKQNIDGHCLQVCIGHNESGTERLLRVLPFFQGDEEHGREYFSGILNLGPVTDATRMMTIAEVNSMFRPLVTHGHRRSTGSGSMVMPLDITALKIIADRYWEFLDPDPRAASLSVLIMKFASQHKVLEFSQTDTAFCNRGNLHETMTSLGWDDEALDDRMATFDKIICRLINQSLGLPRCEKVRGGLPVGRYINYETALMDPEEAFGVNLPRLRSLKEYFDPHNIFNKWQSLQRT